MSGAYSESRFAELVDELAADPDRREQLTDLLREDHPYYNQCGAATIVRMRGWVLLAMARTRPPDAAIVFILEELDAGVDPYLVAASARALRSHPHPSPDLAPFVMHALANIRYRDEPMAFEHYGEYAVSSTDTSAVRELLKTLAWLGPKARNVLSELKALRAQRGKFPHKTSIELSRAIQAIGDDDQSDEPNDRSCCDTFPNGVTGVSFRTVDPRRNSEPVESVLFEDQDGERITFRQFFSGRPSILAFFYTRCDNPLKCSLTIAKIAKVQALLRAEGLADQVRTAAITYDPAFDLPERLRVYGRDRGMQFSENHRMLRATDDNDLLRRHFELGVNFVGSLVNRHRIELYILDASGRTVAFFERIRWDEREVACRAIDLLSE
jgi:cytochrome oxidase Cu insertion factor (SCO1/SenC/PrrC family)